MAVQEQFPHVHWVWKGAISFVYEVHPRIVVKVPKSGDFEREQFRKEVRIYELFSQHPLCPSVVQCFFYTENGIFLEYMRDVSLCYRIQKNHILDKKTHVVIKVEKLEPLRLRKQWMNELAQAVAFLESLNLAHGDLRPENILLDRDQLKLSDFDCTAEFGADFDACMAPYGRILNSDEPDHGRCGSAGFLGPRTEQFALGSLYYFINYGFEVYGDRCLTEEPYEHGPMVLKYLQRLQFPDLDSNPPIDDIIDKCWHNRYTTIADLASHTKRLMDESANTTTNSELGGREEGSRGVRIPVETVSNRGPVTLNHTIDGLQDSLENLSMLVSQNANDAVTTDGRAIGDIRGDFSKREFSQGLESRGLLSLLSSGEPEELGFKLVWYRHSL
ncbi:Protein kinase-like domain protein [Metarhizium rileyi]|uniref:Protein kinase-like domain protein n=1 Tax=Metarhizium rileyi (strain RCEF 4871) TaxID=1649241 RepID=A0A162JDF4_METRR|nr:Protein kinase-like domain protein [Metarhizium rileyi RCEF 4871]